ncbi:M28 family metallopeptidase [Streptosporangium roseum]|uniref:M28 family metallopeptidase n=1 Tax=Streptosporangium roseum TaxID=2001 RepID=UPI000B05162A|nr:M28 family peptidase [Streptosporangium roseum]
MSSLPPAPPAQPLLPPEAIEIPGLAAALQQVSAQRMLASVAELASDGYAGRRVGTPGGQAAATWLAERLRELGADVQLDPFGVSSVRELYGTPVLQWSDGEATRSLEHRREFAEHLASAELPDPRSAPLADLSAADLRGHWVLAPAGQWAQACRRAEAEGAVGVLMARGTDADGWMPKMIAGPGRRAVAVIGVRTDLHRQLADALVSGEVRVRASMPLRTVSAGGVNVHGHLPLRLDGLDGLDGPDGSAGGPQVLLSAHFDGVGDDPSRRLPAAADNASGVAAVLEAARVLRAALTAPVNLSVSFLDAEEAGAWGSAHHAPSVAPTVQVINLDGAAQLQQAAAVEAGGPAHALLATLDQAARLTGVPLRAGAMASDNRRYAAAGLAAIGIGMGMPGYQTPAETSDRVEPETLVAAAHLLIATVWLLAQPPRA